MVELSRHGLLSLVLVRRGDGLKVNIKKTNVSAVRIMKVNNATVDQLEDRRFGPISSVIEWVIGNDQTPV